MKLIPSIAAAAALVLGISTASAHLNITGRNFGAIDGLSLNNNTQTISSSFGWADATDDNWGDSHRTRIFKFSLAGTERVTITVEWHVEPPQSLSRHTMPKPMTLPPPR